MRNTVIVLAVLLCGCNTILGIGPVRRDPADVDAPVVRPDAVPDGRPDAMSAPDATVPDAMVCTAASDPTVNVGCEGCVEDDSTTGCASCVVTWQQGPVTQHDKYDVPCCNFSCCRKLSSTPFPKCQ